MAVIVQTPPLVNGVRHDWNSIKVDILGRTVVGIVEINYSDEQKKENRYGSGDKPTHRGRGNYAANADITLAKYEIDAILKAARAKTPGARLVDIAPFDITVTFLNEEDVLQTDILRNCEFTKHDRKHKQGDTGFDQKLDLIISHID